MSAKLRRVRWGAARLALLCVVSGLMAACARETADPAPAPAPMAADAADRADAAATQTLVIDAAMRQIDEAAARPVTLPDWPLDPPVQPAPRSIRYRIELPARAAALAEPGLLMQGLLANAAVHFNGHLLRAPVHAEAAILPRGLDRFVLLSLPRQLWVAEGNVLQIDARPQNRMSVSRLTLGPLPALAQRHRQWVTTMVIGPLVAGAVVVTLGLGMLGLWARLRETPFGLFAMGALGSGVTNWMPLLSWPSIGGVAYSIAWVSLYGVVVAAFAAFCLRLAGWYRPRLERSLLALAACGPALLGGAYLVDQMDVVSSLWRLMLIAGIGMAFVSVCRAAWVFRTRAAYAMVVCGGVAGALGVHDWLVDLDPGLNNPHLLTPYAGLLFAITATAILIDRYVAAARSSAELNRELEQRVAAQGTQLRQALDEARAARDRAQAADRAKSNFLAVASHDLRQPAHALGLYLSALPDEGLGTESREVLGRMREAHHALERMFEALLDISRMDAGQVTPVFEAVAPAALLQALADEAAPAADAKGLRLVLRLGHGAAQARVSTDALLFERMLRNLIVNAVKYTDRGGVLLACRLRRGPGGEGPGLLTVEVWDTGPGIAPEQRERVFEEFHQLGRPGTSRRASDGLGLGLAIVRRLSRLLGVQVSLRSRVGHGSCFALSLPMAAAAPRLAEAVTAPDTLAGVHVGVLEDEPAVRDAMLRLLARWGCRAVGAADAQGLLAALAPAPARLDLLIVDYALEGEATGPQEALRVGAALGRPLPVLVVTGEQSPERLRELAGLGLPWLSKPVAPAALRAALGGVLANRPQAARPQGVVHG